MSLDDLWRRPKVEGGRERVPEKIYDPERDGEMSIEGDPETVFSALEKQARAVREGQEKDPAVRPLWLVLPGGMGGVFGGSEATALAQAGLIEGFSTVVGISTGAPIAAYALAGPEQARVGNSIFYEECTTKDFIRFKRLLDGYPLDVGFLSYVFRGEEGGKKGLDVAAVRRASPEFYVGVTKYENGKSLLLNAKDPEIDMITALEASAAVPILDNDYIEINDTRYTDGAASDPFPTAQVLEKFKPTHIVVFANAPEKPEVSMSTQVADSLLSRLLPENLKNGWLARQEHFTEGLTMLRNAGIPYTIIWNDRSVKELTNDAPTIRAAAERAELFMRNAIGKHAL